MPITVPGPCQSTRYNAASNATSNPCRKGTNRVGKKGVGFGADLTDATKHDTGVLLAQALPEDLHKFGMIPEFVGRVPVVAHVEELTEADLVRILTEPKNALVKQFQRLFALEDVGLEFTEGAIPVRAMDFLTEED